MPPGAGKTAVGLEAARRLGQRTLVLVPNNAVLGQWADTWNNAFPGAGSEAASMCGTDRTLDQPLTVLTYQSIAVIKESTSAGERHASTRVAQAGGAPGRAAVLDLLHPNGREVIDKAAGLGPWTLVLDECHHLLALWGELVRAIVEILGPSTSVIGLTATPPAALGKWQRDLSEDLFGSVDFEVPTPALVKEGDLAPYQELVYLTAPTPDEDTWLLSQTSRFEDLQLALIDRQLGTVPLLEWLRRRVVERGTPALSWGAFEAIEPKLALAALRFAHAGLLPVPPDARLREKHRFPPDADDWVNILSDFCVGHLQQSDAAEDAEALAAIKKELPGLGYRLTKNGVRVSTSPVDRLCGLSESKVAGAVHILETEFETLGFDLRAVVLCDFETQSSRPTASWQSTHGPLTTESGSARLMFSTLAGASGTPLDPLLITGQTFACPEELAPDLVGFGAELGFSPSAEPLEEGPGLMRIEGLTTRESVAVATRFYEAGHSRVLVGTRGLLGEGWDCAVVNVCLDLTTATTPTAITQMRGRSLRLDPTRPAKVANNWNVCCVASNHPRGNVDYDRLVRKHTAYFGPTAEGLIESGLGHCDPELSPFGPPSDGMVITARALQRAADRDGAHDRWRIGQPYEGIQAATLRIRSERGLGEGRAGLPLTALQPSVDGGKTHSGRAATVGLGALVLAAVPGATTGLTLGAGAGVGGAAAGGLAGGLGLGLVSALQGKRLDADDPALERLARAVVEALHATGAISGTTIAVAPTADGWTRCELTDVPEHESRRFAEAFDELLGPLATPKYLIGRVIVTVPATRWRRLAYLARANLGLALDAAVSWHAVPAVLSGSKAKRQAFADAWAKHVGPARLVDAGSAEGAAVLDLFRGEDPFSILTQMRTTWY